jgi:AraC-like DNA-binding protein
MFFERILPSKNLERFIAFYWIVRDENPTPQLQKIIPDGYTEIIFHLGDSFRINIHGKWEVQSQSLVAGQIKKHFYLQNCGYTNIVAIKLKPAALTQLFGTEMDKLTDKVVPLEELNIAFLNELAAYLHALGAVENKVDFINQQFAALLRTVPAEKATIENVIDNIMETKGITSVDDLGKANFLNERQLQRLFKRYIGLSPKYYSRVIRFSAIFQAIKDRDRSWTELAYETGYYDQSHFIRNFKTFTGEDPSHYLFDDPTLANFFLSGK